MKKRIAIIHPDFSLGGAGSVAVFTLEALKNDFKLFFITTEEVNYKEINEFFGTSFNKNDFTNIVVPKNKLVRKLIKPAFLLKVAFAQRYIKKRHNSFDLLFCTRCEMDFGLKKGIQYIHFPVIKDDYLREVGQMNNGLFLKKGIIRNIYYYFFWEISKTNLSRLRENTTLTNSNWTGEVIKRAYGIKNFIVLYPPVKNDFPLVNWKEKEEGFVCIGKVSSNKRIIEMIKILKKVREAGKNVHFHILGGAGDLEYSKKVDSLVLKYEEWLSWHKKLGRKDMVDLIAKHKYGIHGMKNEHFGIAVAELFNANCIPFVHNSGGQVEIVENDYLKYDSDDDAVRKIVYFLNKKMLQEKISKKNKLIKFDIEDFKTNLLDIIKDGLNK